MAGRFLSALEPVDSDVDLADPAQRRELRREHGAVLGVVAVGGVIGALARYALELAWPTGPAGFPTATLVINLSGSFLLGLLMAVIARRARTHRWVRPFVGTGILGGYTTFSTFAVDVVTLARADAAPTALGYLAATAAGSVLAAALGIWLLTPHRSWRRSR